MWNLFGALFAKKVVGIDLGTSAIKIVEISAWSGGKTLENYAHLPANVVSQSLMQSQQGQGAALSLDATAKALKTMLEEANIKTRKVIFSLPDFSTFSTSFDIPPMPQKEVANAIRYNASQYITLPIEEVTLDWQIISDKSAGANAPMKIFLVAVPNQVITDYQTLARLAGLEIYALEAEAFGLVRSATQNNQKTVCLVDVGAQSSILNIIHQGFLRRSYSFNFYSGQLAQAVSVTLGVPYQEAETIKNKEGLKDQNSVITKTLEPLVAPLLSEIKTICAEFKQSDQIQIQEVYLTGGAANLPGLSEHMAKSLGMPVSALNCFSGFLYPPILEKTLDEMSPGFSAAVGVALGGVK